MIISVEGLEGASKTTSTATIRDVFAELQVPLTVFREPGGTPFAEALRTLHKKNWDEIVAPDTELLIMFASRLQLYINQVLPAARSGVALLDRCWWSTYAYQVFKKMDPTLFWQLVAQIEQMSPVQRVLFLDVDPQIGLMRASRRGNLDRIELFNLSFFERARDAYRDLASRTSTASTVNANLSEDEVQAGVRQWAIEQAQHWLKNNTTTRLET